MLSTNTVQPKDPNAKFARFLKEVQDDQGHVTVQSRIPLRHVTTNEVQPKKFQFDPTLAEKALNKGRRPEGGFRPLQTADMREIEDNKRRIALAAEKRAAASLRKLSDKPAPKAKGKAKKGK